MEKKNVRIHYDEGADVLFIMWGEGSIWESEYDYKRRLVWHFDSTGMCVGVEVLMFSKIKGELVEVLREILSFCEKIMEEGND